MKGMQWDCASAIVWVTLHALKSVMIPNQRLPTSDMVPVSFVKRVLLPTEGNPTKPTLASPTLFTSKPAAMSSVQGVSEPHAVGHNNANSGIHVMMTAYDPWLWRSADICSISRQINNLMGSKQQQTRQWLLSAQAHCRARDTIMYVCCEVVQEVLKDITAGGHTFPLASAASPCTSARF